MKKLLFLTVIFLSLPASGLAAIKYGDLSNQPAKDYVFDVDRFTSFEGDTGPYVLYTMVRIKSILAKYKEQGGNADAQRSVHQSG